jgi:hypothetical protein
MLREASVARRQMPASPFSLAAGFGRTHAVRDRPKGGEPHGLRASRSSPPVRSPARDPDAGIRHIAGSRRATLQDGLHIVAWMTDMYRYRPIVKVPQEMWAGGPYPPRKIVEVHRLNDNDILEVEGTFRVAVPK